MIGGLLNATFGNAVEMIVTGLAMAFFEVTMLCGVIVGLRK